MESATMTPYDETFYRRQVEGSLTSARAILPIVLDLVPARGVVDFGCGRGTWLKVCLENGMERVLGLDGDYVARESLLIPAEHFRPVDLRQPIRLDEPFDLAMCLEVAEHLPAECARALVESLAAAAPIVLFSAAVPGQGGMAHLNEQWPPYWERHFAEAGMRKHDVIRPLVWRDRSVERWYRQNLYLFAREEIAAFDSLDRFEPEFAFAMQRIIARSTPGWAPPAGRTGPLIRRIRSVLSGLIASA
jgi:SAM-dependent methyltransferase